MANHSDHHHHLKAKIAVSGAAETGHCGDNALQLALELGKQITEQGAVTITGATTGFPLWVARGSKEAGGTVVGISPAASDAEHVELYKLPLEYSDLIIYTGSGYSGRNLLLTRAADAVIVGCGRIGTINEFTVAYEDGKPLGVLEGGWATDEVIKNMVKNGHRPNKNLVFSKDPEELVHMLLDLVEKGRKESYGVYANGEKTLKECKDPHCRIIL